MKQRILVVEDSLVNRELLNKILQDEFDICEVDNGKAALALLKDQKEHFAAMILDLQMPELDGRGVLKILRNDYQFKNLPILVATGEHNEKVETECLKLGAWDYVTKPYSRSIITVRLNNIIARSQNFLLREVQHLSQKDVLTNLYNRRYFMMKAKEMMQNYPDTLFCLIRMDIDQFRLYNASFGSEAGDELLKQIAEMIDRSVSENGVSKTVYGRIESDIFCMLTPYHKQKIEEVIEKSHKTVQHINKRYRLNASFGICVIDKPTEDMEELYAHTVEAAKKCKNNINTIFCYYDENMSKNEKRAQELTNEMEKGILKQQFQVYLQPKYSLDTEKTCGAEALVRWDHPQWGMVSPGEFIPVFEQNGLIIQLDYYMWEHVCRLLHSWIVGNMPVVPVSVNVSRVSMYDPNIVSFLVKLTEQYQVPRYLINLEITESAYMSNPDLMKSIIDELRSNGFVILMDDFGSGYSSLNTLKDIDVDILKIDMKFLPTGQNNAKSEKILASVARMAGWLGMPVVVEGVESKEQKDFLKSIGCYYVQGYFYAKPMPVSEFEKLMSEEMVSENEVMVLPEKSKDEVDVVWFFDSGTGALLESVSLPFVVFEYAEPRLDILRMNKAYIHTFALKNLERYFGHKEYKKILDAAGEVTVNQSKSECKCLALMEDGSAKWFYIRLAFIGMAANEVLISGTFSDITTEMHLESELDKFSVAFKAQNQKKDALLIVDDQAISRDILASMFEKKYTIIQARNGQEALDILKEQYDVIAAVLLDMIMPVMDGREFLRYKKQMSEAADIPVIVISSESDEAVQLNMLKNGVNDYVTKPFVPALVKKRLENVLEYNSRFRSLINEYKRSSELSTIKRDIFDDECGTQGETAAGEFEYNTHSMIYLDPLTGAYNRRFLDEMLFLCEKENRVTTELALIMMDLTKFKQINDLFGHQMGDKVLKGVVLAMKKKIRPNDAIVRYGGDEFLVIFTNCGEEQIMESIERLKSAVNSVKYGPKETISAEADFGYAFQERFETTASNLERMIKIADEMMYKNKKNRKGI